MKTESKRVAFLFERVRELSSKPERKIKKRDILILLNDFEELVDYLLVAQDEMDRLAMDLVKRKNAMDKLSQSYGGMQLYTRDEFESMFEPKDKAAKSKAKEPSPYL